MLQYSIVVGACIVLAMMTGTKAAGGFASCSGSDCVKPYVFYDTQNNCTQEVRPPQYDCRWSAGLDRRADEIIYGGHIAAYKLQWFGYVGTSNGWSGWFIPGFNDFDPKFNTVANPSCPLPSPANSLRRAWAYFYDHYHTIVICYSPIKCSPDTSKPARPAKFCDPSYTP